MSYPSAIIFVNQDTSAQVREVLATQLLVSESIDGIEFDIRVSDNPNYVNSVHQQGLRLIVYRSADDYVNRELCDLAINIYQGLAYIEKNKFGPPLQAYPVANISIYNLFFPIG